MTSDAKTAHYKSKYGDWAGMPNGYRPNYAKCCESVFQNHRSYQCSKPNGHGPDGAYCKQHDPAAVAKRQAQSQYDYELRYYNEKVRRSKADGAYGLIEAIAKGHNDPRTACLEWLAANTPTAPVKPAILEVAPVAPPPPPPKQE